MYYEKNSKFQKKLINTEYAFFKKCNQCLLLSKRFLN